MKILCGKHRARSPDSEDHEVKRRKLLATLHIAQKDMRWTDQYYRSLLESCFEVSTAAALSNTQLDALIAAVRNRGWRPKRKPGEVDEQILAFRKRINAIVSQIPNGQERLKGLCKSICDSESVNWCNDVPKMKCLLATLGNLLRKEKELGAVAGGP